MKTWENEKKIIIEHPLEKLDSGLSIEDLDAGLSILKNFLSLKRLSRKETSDFSKVLLKHEETLQKRDVIQAIERLKMEKNLSHEEFCIFATMYASCTRY